MATDNDYCSNLIAFLKKEDIQKYYGESFSKLVIAVCTGDFISGTSAVHDIGNRLFHLPTRIFWGKMQHFLLGTFRDFSEQVKMAEKFNFDNEKYKEYVYMLLETVDKIDSTAKVDYFSNIVRAFILDIIDLNMFYKLRQILLNCTVSELDFVKDNQSSAAFEYDIMIYSLKEIGLVNKSNDNRYVFTDLAKALKTYALSGDDTPKSCIKYLELSAPDEVEGVIWQDF